MPTETTIANDSGTATYLDAVGMALESETDPVPDGYIIGEAHDAIALHRTDVIGQVYG